MAKPYREGKGWCVRKRFQGHDIYLSGYATKAEVEKALHAELTAIEQQGKPVHLGPRRTTLAQGLQFFAMEHLPRLNGAPQELRRINRYLEAAGLNRLAAEPADPSSGLRFVITELPLDAQRRIPQGLTAHRNALMCKTADSDRVRQVLAQRAVADITRSDIQRLADALVNDRLEPATIGLERALLRGFFNYARKQWAWPGLTDNPARDLKLPAIDNARDRVLSQQEQQLLDEAMEEAHNKSLKHAVVLLRETAMRVGEPIEHARWSAVNWEQRTLRLEDGKGDKRDVPLSAAAIDALRALQELNAGKADERILGITYESIKAGFGRACVRAGIEDMRLHDLRHTAATRLALQTGNMFLVKALTGHKTDAMVTRYVNVKASDVVDFYKESEANAMSAAAEKTEVPVAASKCMPQTAVPAAPEPMGTAVNSGADTTVPIAASDAETAADGRVDGPVDGAPRHTQAQVGEPMERVVREDGQAGGSASGAKRHWWAPQRGAAAAEHLARVTPFKPRVPVPVSTPAGSNVIAFPGRRV